MDPETRGDVLAQELNDTLNNEFESRSEYREALESAISFLQITLEALEEDEENDSELEAAHNVSEFHSGDVEDD